MLQYVLDRPVINNVIFCYFLTNSYLRHNSGSNGMNDIFKWSVFIFICFFLIKCNYYININFFMSDPVAARSEARALSTRTLDRRFECRLRHGCLSSSLYVVLFCVGRGLAMS
jgi:hypothetical protein